MRIHGILGDLEVVSVLKFRITYGSYNRFSMKGSIQMITESCMYNGNFIYVKLKCLFLLIVPHMINIKVIS